MGFSVSGERVFYLWGLPHSVAFLVLRLRPWWISLCAPFSLCSPALSGERMRKLSPGTLGSPANSSPRVLKEQGPRGEGRGGRGPMSYWATAGTVPALLRFISMNIWEAVRQVRVRPLPCPGAMLNTLMSLFNIHNHLRGRYYLSLFYRWRCRCSERVK